MEKQHNILLYILIYIYIYYTICFQYAFFVIDGFLYILGFLLMICSIYSGNLKLHKEISFLLFFVVYVFFVNNLLSDNFLLANELLFQIIKYCIPSYAILIYIDSQEENLLNILRALFLSVITLVVINFIYPVVNYSYSPDTFISRNSLNANIFSSFIMIGTMCCTFLMIRCTFKERMVYYFSICMLFFAQLQSASRRGIIIFIFLILIYIFSIFLFKKTFNYLEVIFCILLLLGIFICLFFVNYDYLLDKFVIFERFKGNYTGGDSSRNYYKSIAINLFNISPFFGKGLGAVESITGMYSHSLYYELLASCGLFGMFLFLSFFIKNIFLFIKFSFCCRGLEVKKKAVAFLMLGNNFAVLLCGLAVVLIYDFYMYIMIAVFAQSLCVLEESIK